MTTDDQPPRTRRETLSGPRRQLYLAAIPVLVALASLITAITARVQSGETKGDVVEVRAEARQAKATVVEATRQAGEAKQDAVEATKAAVDAKEAIAETVNPTAKVAVDLARECATKADIEAVHRRINALPLAGALAPQPKQRSKPAAEVPASVKAAAKEAAAQEGDK